MALVARIVGLSLLVAGMGAGLGYALVGPGRDGPGISLLLGCVGAIVGAVAGAAREIVTARSQAPSRSTDL
jgi:hypothetical protein